MSPDVGHGAAHELVHWIAALVLVVGGAILLVLSARARGSVVPARRQGGVAPIECSVLRIVASLSFGAAAIHLIAAPPHYIELGDLGVGFLVAAAFQVAWGVRMLRSPTDRVVWIGIAGNLAIVATWVMSRTIGLPIGPDAFTPEPVGLPDGASTAFELLIVAGLAVRLVDVDRRLPGRVFRSVAAVAIVPIIGIMLLTTSLAAVAIAAGADHGAPPHVSSSVGDEGHAGPSR